MRIIQSVVLSVLALTIAINGYCAAGDLDTSFSTGNGINGAINTVAIQGDGKILIGGEFTEIDGMEINRIARLQANGVVDESFNVGTGINWTVMDIAIQDDGKVIVGGNFDIVNGVVQHHLARLHADGSLDENFNPALGEVGSVNTIALQSDGKIIVGGSFNNIGQSAGRDIVRLDSSGQLDNSYNIGNANGAIMTIELQENGKIIVGGQFTEFNGISHNRIIRLNSNGTVDGEFNPLAGSNLDVLSIKYSSNTKILVGGYFTAFNGVTKNSIVRLNANGFLDAQFGADCSYCAIYSIAIQRDGKVIIGGYFGLFQDGDEAYYLARLNNDGTLDNSFYQGIDGSFPSQTVYDMSVQQDGKLVIAGDFEGYRNISTSRIARIHTGDPDGDGIEDAADYFPADPLEWLDSDGDTVGNNADWDDDGDGVPDVVDAAPLDNGDVSEITLPLNATYKGGVIKQNAAVQ